MKRGIIFSFCSILVLSLVFTVGVAWAQRTLIPIEGTQTGEPVYPGERWMDDDGVLHIRGKIHTSFAEGHDINGVPWSAVGTVVTNVNMNPATGVGDMCGSTQRDYTYGDLQGSLSGKIRATSTAFRWIGEANFPHGTGDFAGWKLVRVNFSRGWKEQVTVMEGFFHIPPGGGGEKSAPLDESSSWGSVKALYR
ncbi:MAG: hypothetical protein DRP71_12925 [Verrucomicrobia bacterium]|nr:MAG: hypothetical protein DRP71_12925 [Verrucomicrobiota bacterium]